jgi:hypothetical protein
MHFQRNCHLPVGELEPPIAKLGIHDNSKRHDDAEEKREYDFEGNQWLHICPVDTAVASARLL